MRAVISALLWLSLLACETPPVDPVCEALTTRSCRCDDGDAGEQICHTDGSGYAPCSCLPANDAGPETPCASFCGGCCQPDNSCVSGNANDACGAGALACVSCGPGRACVAGRCECQPNCLGRTCGSDGCGGLCPPGCPGVLVCDASGGECVVPACSSCADCGADEVCTSGTCQNVWGRRFRVTLESARIPDRTTSGGCWDLPGCGAPDPSVLISVDNTDWRIACADDTYTPAWDSFADILPLPSSSLDFRIIDEDAGGAPGCDGYSNDEECLFRWLGPSHRDYVGTSNIRDLVCAGRFDGTVCPGLSFSFSIEAL